MPAVHNRFTPSCIRSPSAPPACRVAGGGRARRVHHRCRDPGSVDRRWRLRSHVRRVGGGRVQRLGRHLARAASSTASAATARRTRRPAGPTRSTPCSASGRSRKAFTAAAVAELVDGGTLALDDRAGQTRPRSRRPGGRGDRRAAAAAHERADRVARRGPRAARPATRRWRRIGAPGAGVPRRVRRYLYSNAGYTLLALIVEEASGTSYRDYTGGRDPAAARTATSPAGSGTASRPRRGPVPSATSTTARRARPATSPARTGRSTATAALAMTTPRPGARGRTRCSPARSCRAAAVELLTRTRRSTRATGSPRRPGWVAFDASRFGEPAFVTAGRRRRRRPRRRGRLAARAASGSIAVASNTAGVSAEDLLQAVGSGAGRRRARCQPAETAPGDVDPTELAAIAGDVRSSPRAVRSTSAPTTRLAVVGDAAPTPWPRCSRSPGAASRPTTSPRTRTSVTALLAGETRRAARSARPLEADARARSTTSRWPAPSSSDGELRTYVTITAGDAGRRRLVRARRARAASRRPRSRPSRPAAAARPRRRRDVPAGRPGRARAPT